MDRLARKRDCREDGADDEECETEVESQNANVKREEDRADPLRAESERALLRRVAGGDLKRIAAALDKR